MSFTGRPQTFLERTLQGDGFFPELSFGDFQRIYRVPAHMAEDAVEQQLRTAQGEVNQALTAKRAAWLVSGFSSLADVATSNNLPMEDFYLTAIYTRAKAWLLRDFQTFSRRDVADDATQEGAGIYEALLVRSAVSLRRLTGQSPHMTVELL